MLFALALSAFVILAVDVLFPPFRPKPRLEWVGILGTVIVLTADAALWVPRTATGATSGKRAILLVADILIALILTPLAGLLVIDGILRLISRRPIVRGRATPASVRRAVSGGSNLLVVLYFAIFVADLVRRRRARRDTSLPTVT